MPKKIWIDLSNTPHALFFKPIIDALKKKSMPFVVTARQQEQLVEMLDVLGVDYFVVGKHGGKSLFCKIARMLERIFLLWLFALREKPDVVVVHQSFYGIIAGFFARVRKRIYIFDNEKAWIQNMLAFPFATQAICPEAIPLRRLYLKKLDKYPSIKEALYLKNFEPKRKEILNLLRKLGISKNKKLLVFRPEPYAAHYYSSKESLATTLIHAFVKTGRWQVIIVPRDARQRRAYKKEFEKENDVFVLEKVVDLPSLIYYCDAVVSAGGTVAREAVVLGKHSVSIFEGSTLAVDRWLSKNNHLVIVKNEKEARKLPEMFSKPEMKKFKAKNVDILRYLLTKK